MKTMQAAVAPTRLPARIAFVFEMEGNAANMLNNHSRLPCEISWRSIGVAAAPMKYVPIDYIMKSALVLSGNGENALRPDDLQVCGYPRTHGADRLAFIGNHAPIFHVSSSGVPDRECTSWLRHLRAEWAKHPRTYPLLAITQYSTKPMTEATTRHAERLVENHTITLAAGTPNPKTVYLIGAERERKYFSRIGARWRDILIQGQEMGLQANVAPNVRVAVDLAMAAEHGDFYEAGYGLVWPRSMTKRPAPPFVEAEERSSPG
ncbi:hypothetical protein B0T18DRAFT_487946 [Schizothecium vesticola]|uniref:Uncharacterized protein n=1 Tax=Schizothecium vesticola TaxID=314040 RepID=A0AA40F324_9PEZI|nr:hypothetical protein B0T18DRAFT_487946 [Schizothecium vesticola]